LGRAGTQATQAGLSTEELTGKGMTRYETPRQVRQKKPRWWASMSAAPSFGNHSTRCTISKISHPRNEYAKRSTISPVEPPGQ
jgi:hypothetical protein